MNKVLKFPKIDAGTFGKYSFDLPSYSVQFDGDYEMFAVFYAEAMNSDDPEKRGAAKAFLSEALHAIGKKSAPARHLDGIGHFLSIVLYCRGQQEYLRYDTRRWLGRKALGELEAILGLDEDDQSTPTG